MLPHAGPNRTPSTPWTRRPTVAETEILTPDLDAGDVPARRTVLCRHGQAGYCDDDATPAERDAMNAVHRHAYDWAWLHYPEDAEEYAAWYAAQCWNPGAILADAGPHPAEYERFKDQQ